MQIHANNLYTRVIKYVISAECSEPFYTGTEDGKIGTVLSHPVKGIPFIQASSIAGALRDSLSYDERIQKELFGSADPEEDNQNALGTNSRVYFSDGFFVDSSLYTELRPRVRIDKISGTCQIAELKGKDKKSGQKFEMELIAAGSQFEFSAYLFEADKNLTEPLEDALGRLHVGDIQFGGQKNNGCGYIKLISVKKAIYDMEDKKDRILWIDESKEMTDILPYLMKPENRSEDRIRFELSGRTEGGILVKTIAVTDFGENEPDSANIRNIKHQYILPASSIKGVIRGQIEKIVAYRGMQPFVIQSLFGTGPDGENQGIQGKVRFLDSVIGESGDNECVIPQSRIHIDKFTGGVMYGSLFSEKPAYGKITICFDIQDGNGKEKGLLLMALRDIGMGLIPLGSGSSIGRGYINGEKIVVWKGNKKLAEINLKLGTIEYGKDIISEYMKNLKASCIL